MRKLTASGLGAMVLGVLFLAGCGGGGGGTNTTPGILLPVVTITPSAAQSIDQGQSLALSASVANDTGSAGVSWSVVGGGTLSGTTTSATTYTAPASVAAATTTTVTATSVASSSATATHAIVVNPAPAITTSGALTAATINTAYSATLAATGGAGSLSWSVATGSTLPAGLAGTPTTAGTYSFSVQVTDASAATPLSATAALSLTVKPAALSLPAPNPASLPAATDNISYSGAITAAGGVAGYTWTVNGAAVPTNSTPVALAGGLGLSVSSDGSATLSVSGTPSANGTVSFTAAVQDSGGASVGPNTYTIGVLYAVKGMVRLVNVCGSTAAAGVCLIRR